MTIAVAKKDQIPDSELWTRLATTKRPSKEVDFPRKDPLTGEPLGKIAMRPLNQGEIIQAQSAAMIFAKQMLKEEPELAAQIKDTPVYNNACACEILFRACRRPENHDLPIWPTAAAVRDPRFGITSDECAVLMNSYEFVQLELGPIAAFLSAPEQEALIKRLQEGGSALPLATLSLGQWTDLTMHLASQYPSSPTDNGSPGTQLEEPSLSE
jgi:hypothetical protein